MEKQFTLDDLVAMGIPMMDDEDETFMYYTSDNGHKYINTYLLGDSDDAAFLKKFSKKYLKDVKKHIKKLDKLFQKEAKINDNPLFFVYRGMDQPYESSPSREPILLKNYVSTTPDASVAKSFTDDETQCCLFRFHVDVGVQYITVNDYYSEEQGENEILFPRGLSITYMGESKETIEDRDSDRKDTVTIFDYKLTQGPAVVPQTKASVDKPKRCPNGTRRNKIDGSCEPTRRKSTTQSTTVGGGRRKPRRLTKKK